MSIEGCLLEEEKLAGCSGTGLAYIHSSSDKTHSFSGCREHQCFRVGSEEVANFSIII